MADVVGTTDVTIPSKERLATGIDPATSLHTVLSGRDDYDLRATGPTADVRPIDEAD